MITRGKKPRHWFFALGLLSSFTTHAASPVWAIHGAHNTVYLAGSIHLLKTEDAVLPAAFDRAYKAAEALVMEVDLDEVNQSDAAGWMLQHGMLEPGKTLKDLLGAARYNRVAAEATRLEVPLELLQQMKPWVLGVQLLELEYARLGFDPARGVEQQLARRAQTDGKDITGLETLPEQLGALDNLSNDDQAKFLDLIVSEMHEVEAETRVLVNAWRTGDAQKLAAELGGEYQRFPALYRSLVIERNKRWVPQLEQLLKERRDYLVVVGALHLVGDDGVLSLLRRDGFKPESLN